MRKKIAIRDLIIDKKIMKYITFLIRYNVYAHLYTTMSYILRYIHRISLSKRGILSRTILVSKSRLCKRNRCLSLSILRLSLPTSQSIRFPSSRAYFSSRKDLKHFWSDIASDMHCPIVTQSYPFPPFNRAFPHSFRIVDMFYIILKMNLDACTFGIFQPRYSYFDYIFASVRRDERTRIFSFDL